MRVAGCGLRVEGRVARPRRLPLSVFCPEPPAATGPRHWPAGPAGPAGPPPDVRRPLPAALTAGGGPAGAGGRRPLPATQRPRRPARRRTESSTAQCCQCCRCCLCAPIEPSPKCRASSLRRSCPACPPAGPALCASPPRSSRSPQPSPGPPRQPDPPGCADLVVLHPVGGLLRHGGPPRAPGWLFLLCTALPASSSSRPFLLPPRRPRPAVAVPLIPAAPGLGTCSFLCALLPDPALASSGEFWPCLQVSLRFIQVAFSLSSVLLAFCLRVVYVISGGVAAAVPSSRLTLCLEPGVA